jgi:uncharacterized RDD family membrane protein YckC
MLMEIHIAKNGKQAGPYSETQVKEMLASGSLSGSDLAWHEGLTGWVPVESLFPTTSLPPAQAAALMPTVQPPVADFVLAERGSRLGAVLLDCLIAFACMIPGIAILMAADKNENLAAIGALVLGLGFLGLLITQFYLLSTRGQTIGKRIVGVRVIRFADNSNPGFVGACLLRAIVPALIGGVPVLGGVFSLVDICFIFQEDRRCIHDLIAGTRVVKA